MPNHAEQTLRTVGLALCFAGIALSVRGGIDAAGALAAGTLVLVGGATLAVPYAIVSVFEDAEP